MVPKKDEIFPLYYKSDWHKVREHHIAWWNKEIVDPLVYVYCTRNNMKDVSEITPPRESKDKYLDVNYRIKSFERFLHTTRFCMDMVPCFTTEIGPGDLALFAGVHAKFSKECVWFDSVIDDITKAEVPGYDPNNKYWNTTLDLMNKGVKHFKRKSLVSIPDLIEGLDILAALRGTKELLLDMYDYPEHVHRFQRALLELYFEYYDRCYEITKDETGGSYFWVWGPGRTAKIQCDICTMLSTEIFQEFVMPYLMEQCERLDYTFFHLDGIGAVHHLDLLLKIPELDGIQFTPGAGQPGAGDPCWYDLYAKVLKSKKCMIVLGVKKEEVIPLLKELGPEKLMISTLFIENEEKADKLITGLSRMYGNRQC